MTLAAIFTQGNECLVIVISVIAGLLALLCSYLLWREGDK